MEKSFTRRSKRLNKRLPRVILRLQDEQAKEAFVKDKLKKEEIRMRAQRALKFQEYMKRSSTKRNGIVNKLRNLNETKKVPSKISSKLRINASSKTKTLSRKLGCVDSVAENLLKSKANINVVTEKGDIFDVELVQIELSQNIDKFYIIQLLGNETEYFVFTKWGRTGSVGQTQLLTFNNFEDAKSSFEEKFLEKTHNRWNARKRFVKHTNYYNMIVVDHNYKETSSNRRGMINTPDIVWEYYVDDHVDGKATGWYPYTTNGGNEVEKLWVSFQSNKDMVMRVIESGHFSYLVDFKSMIQTNTSHPNAKRRQIRRQEVSK